MKLPSANKKRDKRATFVRKEPVWLETRPPSLPSLPENVVEADIEQQAKK